MRVRVTVTDDHGQTFAGELDLSPTTQQQRSAAARSRPAPPPADARLDFGLPRRAFLKKHAQGSGPRKFAVLLAHMTGGKTGVQVASEDVETAWARNRGVLGGAFAPVYATRSKGEGWSDSPKRGMFVLRPEWRGALAK